VYVIEEGQCEALREHNGKQELLAGLDRGAYFGEMALLRIPGEVARESAMMSPTIPI